MIISSELEAVIDRNVVIRLELELGTKRKVFFSVLTCSDVREGIVEAMLKKYGPAQQSYLTALTHRRKYPDCYYNLGNLVRFHSFASSLVELDLNLLLMRWLY